MPMNPRLLRPTSSTLDRDAAIYLNAVAFADGQQLEPAVRKAINDFVIGCKRDGIWTAIKASCILMGARTLSGALTPLVGTAPTNNGPFVAADYDRKTGLLGNGSTKHLDTNRNNNADPQDSQHLAIYASTVSAITRHYMGAGNTSATGNSVIGSAASAGTGLRVRSRAITNSIATGVDAVGFLGKTRGASASFTIRASGTSSTHSVTSGAPQSANVFVFGSNNGGITLPTAARLAFYSIGENLDLALLDSRVSALYTAIGAAIP